MLFKVVCHPNRSLLSHPSHLARICRACFTSLRNFYRCGGSFHLRLFRSFHTTRLDDGSGFFSLCSVFPSDPGLLFSRTNDRNFIFGHGKDISHGHIFTRSRSHSTTLSLSFFFRKIGESSVPCIINDNCLYQPWCLCKILIFFHRNACEGSRNHPYGFHIIGHLSFGWVLSDLGYEKGRSVSWSNIF